MQGPVGVTRDDATMVEEAHRDQPFPHRAQRGQLAPRLAPLWKQPESHDSIAPTGHRQGAIGRKVQAAHVAGRSIEGLEDRPGVDIEHHRRVSPADDQQPVAAQHGAFVRNLAGVGHAHSDRMTHEHLAQRPAGIA